MSYIYKSETLEMFLHVIIQQVLLLRKKLLQEKLGKVSCSFICRVSI